MNLPLRIAPRWWALGLLCAVAAACGQPSTGPSPMAGRAMAGDTVSVVQYYVRPDGRARFEQFLRESYWPTVQQLSRTEPARVRGFAQTRIIFPVRANPDGTYTYVFLLDPMVSGESYRILELLQGVYPAPEAEQRYRLWAETWARPFTSQVFVQSDPSQTVDAAAAPAGTP